MDPDRTPQPKSPDSPSLTFSLWNIGWLLIFLLIACHWFTHRPKEVIDDWSGETTPNADYWNGGIFLNRPADRIRRIATYRRDRVELPIRFFVSIPMTEREYEEQILDSRRFRISNRAIAHPPYKDQPEWFPSPRFRVGTIDEDTTTLVLFRCPGDNHLYVYQ